MELKWDKVKDVKSYAVRVDFAGSTVRDERNNCSGSPHYVCIDGLTENKISINVEPAKKYGWWVHAIDVDGNYTEPASAYFSIKEETAGNDNFLANIFGSSPIKTLPWIIIVFVLGYLFGRGKKISKAKSIEQFRLPPLPPSAPSPKF
jgi:hypothetical protein